MSDDLIERLRQGPVRIIEHYTSCSAEEVDDVEDTMTEAADELTRLRAEVDRLTKQLNDADTILGTYIVLFGDIFDNPSRPIKGLRGMLNAP